MLKRLRKYGLLALALALFVGFWSAALTGSLPVPHHQENQSVSRSGEQCTTHECRQEANEQALSDYTGRLAWFTAVLAIVSFVQGIFLWRADMSSKKAFEVSTAATKISQDLAHKQFLLEADRADTAKKEIGVLREQFFATHRPKLEVRFPRRLQERSGIPLNQQSITVEFSVINTGGSAATVIGSSVRLDWFYPDDLPSPDALGGRDDIIPIRNFGVSVRDRYTIKFNPPGGLVQTITDELNGKRLYLLGYIVYADGRGSEFGANRTTYFCRVADTETKLFTAISLFPDWEFIQ